MMMDSPARQKNRVGKILVFSAASGAGKTTLLTYLIETIPGLVYSISATTRKPRSGEINGKHYFFLSKEEFESKIANNEFAEWEQVHGNYYGTPRSFIESVVSSGNNIVMDIDVFGKKKFDTVFPEAVGILITLPSMEELEKRLRARNTDDEATILLRLQNAKTEIEFALSEGKYEHVIVNDNLEDAKIKISELIRTIIDG